MNHLINIGCNLNWIMTKYTLLENTDPCSEQHWTMLCSNNRFHVLELPGFGVKANQTGISASAPGWCVDALPWRRCIWVNPKETDIRGLWSPGHLCKPACLQTCTPGPFCHHGREHYLAQSTHHPLGGTWVQWMAKPVCDVKVCSVIKALFCSY